MQRFFCPLENVAGDKIVLHDQSQIHHLKDVLRLKIREEAIVFDNKGNEYSCIIEELSPQAVAFKINKIHNYSFSKGTRITVACAIPKGARMDEIIDKLTQLGIDKIIPLITERVIVKLGQKQKLLRLRRWEKIALSASQQSQRNTLPIIEPIKGIKEILTESAKYDLKLIPTLSGERKTVKDVLSKFKPANILILIGPEGDFTSEEIDLARHAGCIPVLLGDLVLRVETAAVAIASFISLYEDR